MFEYILLGAMQGIFEWIPISSEAIVALTSQFMGNGFNPIDVALFLHLGTFLAVMVYFYKDWKDIFLFRNIEMVRFLTIATIVSLIVGYPLYNLISNVAVGNWLLFLTGFALLFTAYFQKKQKRVKIKKDRLAIVSGFLQGLAVIPGLSRSGSTIFGLSLGEDDPAEILKISYLMSAPVVLASSAYLFLKDSSLFVCGFPALISSFIVGLLGLFFLMKIINKVDFFRFVLLFSFLCFLGAGIGLL